jgi:hypothetical protein
MFLTVGRPVDFQPAADPGPYANQGGITADRDRLVQPGRPLGPARQSHSPTTFLTDTRLPPPLQPHQTPEGAVWAEDEFGPPANKVLQPHQTPEGAVW